MKLLHALASAAVQYFCRCALYVSSFCGEESLRHMNAHAHPSHKHRQADPGSLYGFFHRARLQEAVRRACLKSCDADLAEGRKGPFEKSRRSKIGLVHRTPPHGIKPRLLTKHGTPGLFPRVVRSSDARLYQATPVCMLQRLLRSGSPAPEPQIRESTRDNAR